MSQHDPAGNRSELDKHIVGQDAAKRAVAIALRNRWRRQQVAEPLRHEITPKNILMIGPTGVGKTEIARRLARLADAPFIKVEATKFTEVGYVGRDVDTIIRDLVEIARQADPRAGDAQGAHQARGRRPKSACSTCCCRRRAIGVHCDRATPDNATRQTFRKRLREGELDDREIEIELAAQQPQMEIIGAARHGRNDRADPGHVLRTSAASGARPRKLKIARR